MVVASVDQLMRIDNLLMIHRGDMIDLRTFSKKKSDPLLIMAKETDGTILLAQVIALSGSSNKKAMEVIVRSLLIRMVCPLTSNRRFKYLKEEMGGVKTGTGVLKRISMEPTSVVRAIARGKARALVTMKRRTIVWLLT